MTTAYTLINAIGARIEPGETWIHIPARLTHRMLAKTPATMPQLLLRHPQGEQVSNLEPGGRTA